MSAKSQLDIIPGVAGAHLEGEGNTNIYPCLPRSPKEHSVPLAAPYEEEGPRSSLSLERIQGHSLPGLTMPPEAPAVWGVAFLPAVPAAESRIGRGRRGCGRHGALGPLRRRGSGTRAPTRDQLVRHLLGEVVAPAMAHEHIYIYIHIYYILVERQVRGSSFGEDAT